MGFILDLLKDIPLSAVLKERLNLVEKELETLRDENRQLKEKVRKLEKPSGPKCPRCQGEFKFAREQDPVFGKEFGLIDRVYQCASCGFEEARQYDPAASLPK